MISGEYRCDLCNKRLFDVEDLDIAQGAIKIKCKCKHMNTLQASDLTEKRIRS